MRRVTLVVLALTLAGCSSTSGPDPRAGSTVTSTAGSPAVTTPATTSPSGQTPPVKTTAPPNATTSGGSGSQTARLDRACVRSGVVSDVQGITIKTTAGGPASYYSFYSDGTSVREHPEFGAEGQGGGFADNTGTFRDTWTVPAGAPLGRVLVRVTVAGRRTPIDLAFSVVASSASCP